MSSFSGFFDEIPGISADRFLERNRTESTVFFLSHCHTDHMLGFHLPDPLPGPLYTSHISAVFLKHRHPQLAENVRPVDIGETITIALSSTGSGTTRQQLLVTTIPAGHCPGSVMFLFETENGAKVLYTGDFRLSPKDLRNILALREVTPDAVYLDTTFFNQHYRHFPPQSESLRRIVELSNEWLAADKRNVISIKLPALYGSEFLFMELSRQLREKIHVQRRELQSYRFLASLDDAVTLDEGTSRIHACAGTKFEANGRLSCRPEVEERHVRVIRPSAMRWKGLTEGEPFWRQLRREGGGEFAVCYSNHASCAELEDFLGYLRPKAVRFNVMGKDDPEGLGMRELMERVCSWAGEENGRGDCEESREPLKFDGIVYREEKAKNGRKVFTDEESSDGEDAVINHVPKRVRNC